MHSRLKSFIQEQAIKGFLAQDEGEALHALALSVKGLGPCLELGSYCGLSTLYIASACAEVGTSLYAVDHHRGSEEHQLGEEYHDPDLYDASIEKMDSFKEFRRNIDAAQLNDTVVPIVCSSALARRDWATPLAMVFIDGGHSEAMALEDCLGWSKHIVSGGYLAVHDIFEKPEEGGQGPWKALNAVLASGEFELMPQINSLGVLRKL